MSVHDERDLPRMPFEAGYHTGVATAEWPLGVPVAAPKVETNASGGSQSYIGSALTDFPARVLLAVGRVFYVGRKNYGADNWKRIPVNEHLDHALTHIGNFLEHRKPGDLVHAICRLAFAAWLATVERPESIDEVTE